MFSIKRIGLLAALLVFSVFSAPAQAQVVNEVQAFNFGTWVVTNNDNPRHITVATDGSYSNSPELIMITPPLQGVYNVTGLPPGAAILSIIVTMTQPMQAGVGEEFTLDQFTVFNPPNADGLGELQVVIGARARTSGSDDPYNEATYNGELDLDINF